MNICHCGRRSDDCSNSSVETETPNGEKMSVCLFKVLAISLLSNQFGVRVSVHSMSTEAARSIHRHFHKLQMIGEMSREFCSE